MLIFFQWIKTGHLQIQTTQTCENAIYDNAIVLLMGSMMLGRWRFLLMIMFTAISMLMPVL